jgi:predicted nucleotidyltransferase
MNSPIRLQPEERRVIEMILAEQVPTLEVRAFGSRVTGRTKPMSDLDLFIVDDPPLPPASRHRLSEAFVESSLSFRIDLVYQSDVTRRFLDLIEQTSVPFIPPRRVH